MNWRRMTWLSLLITLAGPVSYFMTLYVPFLARTGFLFFGLMACGAVLSIVAARNVGGRAGMIWSVVNVGLALFFSAGFIFGSRVPAAPSSIALHAEAPLFELSDQNGQTVRLADELAKGPVLLVFYRGYW
jgi:hypothetical protein